MKSKRNRDYFEDFTKNILSDNTELELESDVVNIGQKDKRSRYQNTELKPREGIFKGFYKSN